MTTALPKMLIQECFSPNYGCDKLVLSRAISHQGELENLLIFFLNLMKSIEKKSSQLENSGSHFISLRTPRG